MGNDTRKLILAILLIPVLAVSYYFIYYLPKTNDIKGLEQKQQRLLEASRKCNEDASSYYDRFYIANNDTSEHYTWDKPEFHFNGRLNTCLIATRYISFSKFESARSQHYNQVDDVYGNKTILYGWFSRDVSTDPWQEKTMDVMDNTPNYTSNQYLQEKSKLFSE